MSSPADILKEKGEWIHGKVFAKLVANCLDKSERQTYRIIKKATKEGKIRLLVLPDRNTLYGLPSWSFSETKKVGKQNEAVTFKDVFRYDCFKSLRNIANENINGISLKAFRGLEHLIEMLPMEPKNKLKAHQKSAAQKIDEVSRRHREYVLVKDQPFLLGRMGSKSGEERLCPVFNPKYISDPIARNARIREVVKELLGKVSEILHNL